MKKFTIKDFITYNNPCISCGKFINFRISVERTDNNIPGDSIITDINAVVFIDHTDITLINKYNTKLNLMIIHKTNEFTTNNISLLKTYFEIHNLRLISDCSECHTMVQSNKLVLNFNKSRINLTEIMHESLVVKDGDVKYIINSSHDGNQSTFTILDKDFHTTLSLKMPLMPLYKFRDRQHLLEKCKLICLMS